MLYNHLTSEVLDAGGAAGPVLETDGVAHLAAHLGLPFLGDAPCDRDSRLRRSEGPAGYTGRSARCQPLIKSSISQLAESTHHAARLGDGDASILSEALFQKDLRKQFLDCSLLGPGWARGRHPAASKSDIMLRFSVQAVKC